MYIKSGSNKNQWIWLRKNGVDVSNSAIGTEFNAGPPVTVTDCLMLNLNANDYIELWMAADTIQCSLIQQPIVLTTPTPAPTSVQLTINQIG